MKNNIKEALYVLCAVVLIAGAFAFKAESAKYAPNGAKYEMYDVVDVKESAKGLHMVSVPEENGVLTFEAYAKQEAGETFYAPSGSIYQYTYTKDTITNAANDTLYLPSSLRPVYSDFQMIWSVVRTNISGTTNLAVKVEETPYAYTSTTPPSAGWAATLNSAIAAAATAATTATTENLYIPHAYGINFRTIIDGTGTQSSSYVIRVVLKKKT